MTQYSIEFKEQIIKETKEVGNVALVCKRHGLKFSTVHGWLHRSKNKSQIDGRKANRTLEKIIKEQEHEILVLRALLKKTFPLWNNEKPLS